MEQALHCYREFTAQKPDDPRGLNKVGAALANMGEIDKAKAHFEQALRLDAKFVPALTNLGNVCLQEGDIETAIEHYNMAIKIDDRYGPAHHNLSVALKRQGNVSGMVRSLKQAQRLQRDAMRTEARENWKKGPAGCLGRAAPVFLLAMGGLGFALTRLFS